MKSMQANRLNFYHSLDNLLQRHYAPIHIHLMSSSIPTLICRP